MGNDKWWLFKKLYFGVTCYVFKGNEYDIVCMVSHKKLLLVRYDFIVPKQIFANK